MTTLKLTLAQRSCGGAIYVSGLPEGIVFTLSHYKPNSGIKGGTWIDYQYRREESEWLANRGTRWQGSHFRASLETGKDGVEDVIGKVCEMLKERHGISASIDGDIKTDSGETQEVWTKNGLGIA